ncbi:MAG TPA: cyclase family protein [Candidatus Dormibacteraeota bacterium]|nr:cyclase family protein [Candidatus Dormibacteraeota bacterium]
MKGASWGRWGEDDERGALNLIDTQAVRRGLDAARRGQVIPLGLPVQARRVPVVPPRPPVLHTMLVDGGDFEAGARRGPNGFQYADDHLSLACHSGTHIDALSHVARDGLMYNGIPASEVRSTTGARRLGIDRVGGMVCRGVLVDALGAANGSLEAGRVITVADLERALGRTAVTLQPGDAVLIRTGWLSRFDDRDPSWYEGEPGIDVESARWLADQGVVLVGADNFAVEALPAASGEPVPVHLAMLQERGVYLLELVDLEPLAAAGAWTFTFVLAPLRITGGVGSPVNPLAII